MPANLHAASPASTFYGNMFLHRLKLTTSISYLWIYLTASFCSKKNKNFMRQKLKMLGGTKWFPEDDKDPLEITLAKHTCISATHLQLSCIYTSKKARFRRSANWQWFFLPWRDLVCCVNSTLSRQNSQSYFFSADILKVLFIVLSCIHFKRSYVNKEEDIIYLNYSDFLLSIVFLICC